MSLTIQLITQSLYQEPMVKNLIPKGYKVKIMGTKTEKPKLDPNRAHDVIILQAHLWPNYRQRLNGSSFMIMLGAPSWFYCWFEVIPQCVSAYITPYDPSDTLSSSLEWILEGNHYLSSTMETILNNDKKGIQEQLLKVDLYSHLTPCELEVLSLVGEGYTTSEIASKRFRSEHTIKTQRKKVRKKLGFEYGERLASFAGREIYTLKTLLSIEKNREILNQICQNTS